MASGVVDVLLAILVLALGPISSAVLLGFIIAIDLAIAGIAGAAVAVALSGARRRSASDAGQKP